MTIENIAFSSGGILSISFCGVIKALEEKKIMGDIKRFSGSSAGAIFAMLLCCGYTSEEIGEIISSENFDSLKDEGDLISNMFRLVFNFGFYSCSGFYNWIGSLFSKKGFNENCTFKELFEITHKELIITGTHLNKMKTVYYSSKKTPYMSIRDALRISTCIPIYFEPVEELNQYYLDGGVFCPCPINIFEECDPNLSKTLAVYIENNITYKKEHSINNIFQFINLIFRSVVDQAEKFIYKQKYSSRTIYINPKEISSIDFDLCIEKKRSLIRKGYRQTNKFFNNN